MQTMMNESNQLFDQELQITTMSTFIQRIEFFQENNKIQWSGPAKVIGEQGKVVFLKYGNMLRRVHTSRIIRVGEEFKQNNEHTSEEIKKNEIAIFKTKYFLKFIMLSPVIMLLMSS